ncbi:carbon-nitrogen hydrolase family protein [Aquamicrobium sp. LC103]|uniref:carbon-nitrogen hydrolase family protein n=1 Tax=Aquamicrobium sp. LC103 TaxID=1120658 RepID=UPI00063E7628|nr:carbon-nitrogen hydrolase family protein [Aquamicrobium sp. LC103]TKT77455.1 carbon-nitrogen hydrolase family protein [Aquamicrobium sp. LC103]
MRIAALQMQALAGDTEANLARIERAARAAAEKGADLLIAPELAVTGYGAGATIHKLAEPANGAIVARLQAMATENAIAIIAGFAETAGDSVYNSAVFTDGTREPTVYRKSHLYGPYERDLFVPERPSAVVVEHGGMKIGMLICYDVEFPENVRRLAKSGATLIAVPTALPASDHAAFIARQMISVRAFENQVFVAYVNHCGRDPLYAYAGLSAIAAPDGSLLAEAGVEAEALVFADIRPVDFTASAEQNTYLRDLVT